MQKQNRTTRRSVCALLIALLCVASVAGIGIQTAFARTRIDTDKTCSLLVETGGTWEDLAEVEIPVTLYRVADVSADGVFTALDAFADVDVAGADENTSAADWEALARTAAADVDSKSPDAAKSFVITNGTGTASDLPAGLYLVYAADVQTPRNTYTFTPYLISLPDNTYQTDGNDTWIYENVAVSLKPEQTPRYGAISITKELLTCNTSTGTPLFVFDVEATLDGETVYSNVLSLQFSEAGVKTLTVDNLPAGAQVTVTEVYAGASYTCTSDESVTLTVSADETENAAFTNDYDETQTYGTGVVNHFAYDGEGYSWEQLSDNE